MKKYLTLFIFIFLTACITTEPQISEDPETRARLEEQKQIQKDMKHNRCVSKGFVVSSPDYKSCMDEAF
jgi:hypothetical protein